MKNWNQILTDPCLDETKKPMNKKPFVKCIKKNKAFYACTNQDCNRFPFICPDDDCQCQKQHNACSLLVIKNIKRALKNKVVNIKPIENIIQTYFQKMIVNIYNYKNLILETIRNNFNGYFGLESYESDFIKASYNQKANLITGKQIWKIQLNLKNESKQSAKIKQTQLQIINYCRKFQQEGKYFYQNITKRLERYKNGLFLDSKIVKNEQQVKIMQGFFLGKEIKKATLLFIASENMFDFQRFHKNCDGITHTLTICQTQYGYKIGGYTPLAWNSTGQMSKDSSYQTFTFSLTNNKLFKQVDQCVNKVNQMYKIYSQAGSGPCFDNTYYFLICNNASINSYYSNLCGDYQNKKYQNGYSTYQHCFSGSFNQNFKLKECEVYKIQF